MVCNANASGMVGPEGRQTPTGTGLLSLDMSAPWDTGSGHNHFNEFRSECPTIPAFRSGRAISCGPLKMLGLFQKNTREHRRPALGTSEQEKDDVEC